MRRAIAIVVLIGGLALIIFYVGTIEYAIFSGHASSLSRRIARYPVISAFVTLAFGVFAAFVVFSIAARINPLLDPSMHREELVKNTDLAMNCMRTGDCDGAIAFLGGISRLSADQESWNDLRRAYLVRALAHENNGSYTAAKSDYGSILSMPSHTAEEQPELAIARARLATLPNIDIDPRTLRAARARAAAERRSDMERYITDSNKSEVDRVTGRS